MGQVATLITYREVCNKEPTLPELHALMQKYRRREFVTLIAHLNCILGTWQNAPNFDVDTQLSGVLLGKYHDRVQVIRSLTGRRIVFSRVTLLYLIKQACITCPDEGLLVQTEDARVDVGLACLMVNDLLLPFVPNASDNTLKNLTNLLPFADYIGHNQYPMDIGRTLMMFNEISQLPALKDRTDFLDIKGLFEQHLGLPIDLFCELVFGCSTKFLGITLNQLESSTEVLFLRTAYLQKTKIDAKQIHRFLQKVSITDQDLKNSILQAANRPEDDFTALQGNPLMQIGPDLYVCLDPGFLVDKAGRGAIWTLFAEISDKATKLALLSFWGAVFEEYVNHILLESYRADGDLFPNPQFTNGDEAFDACFLEDRDLTVLEHKSSTLRADAKYGGNPEKLRQQLELKFIRGDDEGKKGVAQINCSLQRFLGGEDIAHVGANAISRVYSVLVCLDNSVIVPLMGRYFNEQFRAQFPRKKFRKKKVTPIFTLGISDLENMLGYLNAFSFSQILESYYRSNPNMMSSMSHSSVPLLRDAIPGKNVVRERFTAFAKQMETDLFGVTAEAQPQRT